MTARYPKPDDRDPIATMSTFFGRASAWCALATVVVCASVAILRYVFGIGFPWMQGLYIAFFAACIMGGAAEVYRANEHVRVDIFSRRLAPRTRNLIEIAGITFFLTPWLVTIIYASLAGEHSFVRSAFSQLEGAAVEGGLPGVFLMKALIPLGALLLLLQGFATLSQRLSALDDTKNRQK
ncbi:MAG: TRAP transporter small permease subunit [Hyphomicrobiales bacterium]|nr:TRAP transporter small permease subunit [Hyphomicrobiales bacterium]